MWGVPRERRGSPSLCLPVDGPRETVCLGGESSLCGWIGREPGPEEVKKEGWRRRDGRTWVRRGKWGPRSFRGPEEWRFRTERDLSLFWRVKGRLRRSKIPWVQRGRLFFVFETSSCPEPTLGRRLYPNNTLILTLRPKEFGVKR